MAAPSAAIRDSSAPDVHVALEIEPRLRVARFRDGEIDGARAGEFHIGAGGIEVRVGGHDVAGLAHHGEEDALGGASLVGGHHVAESGERVGHALEAEEALAAGVAFVAAHDGGPLLGGHGAGAGIGEQVDQDVAGVDQEEIVAGRCEIALAFRRGGVVQRLHALDAEGFDDGAHEQIIAGGKTRVWTRIDGAAVTKIWSGIQPARQILRRVARKSVVFNMLENLRQNLAGNQVADAFFGGSACLTYCSMMIWTRLLSTPSAVM